MIGGKTFFLTNSFSLLLNYLPVNLISVSYGDLHYSIRLDYDERVLILLRVCAVCLKSVVHVQQKHAAPISTK